MPENQKEMSLVAQGSSKFGLDLYNRLVKPEENVIFSSYSVASVLSMTSLGAKGSTLEEMKSVLQLPEDSAVLQKAYASFSSCLNSGENVKLEIAHGMFPSKEVTLCPEFVRDAQKYFSSEIEQVDFRQKEASTKQLNDWVSSKTHDKIKELFSKDAIEPDTVSVLINAIYFKGDWMEKFDASLTSNRPFHVAPGKTLEVPTMFADMKVARDYSKELKCDIIALPYKGERIKMYIFLPKDQFGLRDLESKLADKSFDGSSIFEKDMFKGKIDFYMPKFKIESMHNVKDGLQEQGLSQLFLRSCDLSGIGGAPGDICVSKAIQKAMIEVNEEGSEAAAATGIMIAPCCAMIDNTLEVNHPFVFMIRDSLTGLILFTGRVVNPLL